MKSKSKKSVMGPVVSILITVLVVAILAGLTFLFIAGLKTNVLTQTRIGFTVANETGFINATGDSLNTNTALGFTNPSISSIMNITSGLTIQSANYTIGTDGAITNASAIGWNFVSINYTYSAVDNKAAFNAVNGTEAAGFTVVSYLPLIFLALIFGAILTLVLRIILPYINLGQSLGGNF